MWKNKNIKFSRLPVRELLVINRNEVSVNSYNISRTTKWIYDSLKHNITSNLLQRLTQRRNYYLLFMLTVSWRHKSQSQAVATRDASDNNWEYCQKIKKSILTTGMQAKNSINPMLIIQTNIMQIPDSRVLPW